MTMASDTATGCTEGRMTVRADEIVSPVNQDLEDVGDRLVTLSERIKLCNRVLNDLNDLSKVLLRKSVQDVSLPAQK